MAVIAGFLLTAVRNWTTMPIPQRLRLLLLLWIAERLLILGDGRVTLAGGSAADLLFGILLLVALAQPVAQTRQ